MNATATRRRLLIGGRTVAWFWTGRIVQSLYVAEAGVVVVRTQRSDFRDHRNVYGFSRTGRRLWRVGASGGRSRFGRDPYVDVGVYDAAYLLALTMRGVVAIDVRTGAVAPLQRRLVW